MKHSLIQLFRYSIIQLLITINCLSCISEYEPPDIEEVTDILVVGGIITDYESTITLTRSVNITEGDYSYPVYVDNAIVYIECDDGTQWRAEPYIPSPSYSSSSPWGRNGRYIIRTGQLDLERKYCLKIEIEEIDNSKDCTVDPWSGGINCPTKIYKYSSDFSHPLKTPEIDNVFWLQSGYGQPVIIRVVTHSPDNRTMYHRWSYEEDWEINSAFDLAYRGYPFYCWNSVNSRNILLGSSERTVFGQLTGKILEISSSDRRLSVLYRIDVKQNTISKRAYDYFENIKKNADNMSNIFAPVPSELRGNIACITDPSRPVIGYVEVSTTTQMIRYISRSEILYQNMSQCRLVPRDELIGENGRLQIPVDHIPYDDSGEYYVDIRCVDCRYYGTLTKPNNWPK